MRGVYAGGRDSRAASSSSSSSATAAPATGSGGRWIGGHGVVVYAVLGIGVYFVVEEEVVHAMSPGGSLIVNGCWERGGVQSML